MKELKEFLKQYQSILIIIGLVIAFLLYASSREKQIARIAADKARIEQQFKDEHAKRTQLEIDNFELLLQRDRFKQERDSVIAAQEKQKKYYESVIRKHKKEIDSLMNVPNDTVFVRLQPLFPNFDQGPLLYPFSGSQIRQIYFTAISYPRLQAENSLQAGLLKTCEDLNKEYEKSEKNYDAIIDNLNKNIASCDKQVGLKDEQLRITERQLSKKTFWNWTQKGVIAVAAALIIIK